MRGVEILYLRTWLPGEVVVGPAKRCSCASSFRTGRLFKKHPARLPPDDCDRPITD